MKNIPSKKEICENSKVNTLILGNIQKIAKEKDLKEFEIPKKVHLDSECFSLENKLLTPTFKMKRKNIEKKYENVIKSLFEDMN